MYSITSDAKKHEINLSTENISENSTSTEKAKQIKKQAVTKRINELKEGWKDKPLHGKYPICASDPEANSSLTHQWVASSCLKPETAPNYFSRIPGAPSLTELRNLTLMGTAHIL